MYINTNIPSRDWVNSVNNAFEWMFMFRAHRDSFTHELKEIGRVRPSKRACIFHFLLRISYLKLVRSYKLQCFLFIKF